MHAPQQAPYVPSDGGDHVVSGPGMGIQEFWEHERMHLLDLET